MALVVEPAPAVVDKFVLEFDEFDVLCELEEFDEFDELLEFEVFEELLFVLFVLVDDPGVLPTPR